jgi:hypothetical protein
MQNIVNSVHISNHRSYQGDANVLYDVGGQTKKRSLASNENTHANYKHVQKLEGCGMALIIYQKVEK